MAGRIGGVLLTIALVGGLFVLSPPPTAESATECGPVTLDQIFPGRDRDGDPIPTTTTVHHPQTTTSTPTSTTIPGETTTTTEVAPSPPQPPTTVPPSIPAEPCRTWTYEMEFPVATGARVISDFGDDRDGGVRKHKGSDLVADRMAPVVAVADGVVASIHNLPAEDCCYVMIRHDDGWSSLYVHLNNDTYPGDDGLGIGVAPGLDVGTRVAAGQVIGWVGDSGNAEGSIPHLHFELRHPDGYAVDPAASLRLAQSEWEGLDQIGVYRDDDDLPVQLAATRLVTAGGYWPCESDPFLLCPNRLAQPEDTAALIGQLMGISPILVDTVQQRLAIEDHIPQGTLGMITGCDPVETCLQTGITAGDVARMISWVHDARQRVALEPDTDLVSAIPLPTMTTAEASLRFRGVIAACHGGIDGQRLVTRADVIDLAMWWIVGESPLICTQKFDPDV